ncbi:MAG TPA: hypothetical protein DCE48_17095 [Lachnospiraceae bacterium]|uniref:hypothetical protein n=1 Tax=Anaerosporobacter sp. TaxID=1872529 RepID=UPI000EE8CCA4|nr:hypothetical protein [Anaerosporobacter sp.]HAB62381.1 hypothetical protein [Lachnospiraceae bacterium]
MKYFIKIVGVLGLLGVIYLAPGVKVSAATSCTSWVVDSSYTECINGVKYYNRVLKKTCIDEGGNVPYTVTDYDRYPIGTC